MNIKQQVDKKALIDQNVSSEDLFRKYFGEFQLGALYHSPLRKDEHPSVTFYKSDTGQIRMKDFATGENPSGMDFVMALYNLTFVEALNKICADFQLMNIDFKANIVKNLSYKKELVEKKHKHIQFVAKRFTQADVDFFSGFGIRSVETLKFFNMYCVDKLFIDRKKYAIKPHELVFAQFFPKSNHTKIYFPEREKGKRFIGNVNNNEDIIGYWQLNPTITKPELALFTSSNKEIMFLYEREIGSVALNGELHHPNPDFIRHMKKHCNVIKTLNDWDLAGEKANLFFKEKYKIEPILKPEYIDCNRKDITDCWKYGNKEQVEQFIKEIKENI